jgi:hypothetical protein
MKVTEDEEEEAKLVSLGSDNCDNTSVVDNDGMVADNSEYWAGRRLL